jgi:hypothetical protein
MKIDDEEKSFSLENVWKQRKSSLFHGVLKTLGKPSNYVTVPFFTLFPFSLTVYHVSYPSTLDSISQDTKHQMTRKFRKFPRFPVSTLHYLKIKAPSITLGHFSKEELSHYKT